MLPNGWRKYPVDEDRLDRFFDHLVHALVFAKYGRQLNPREHRISHLYLSLISEEPLELAKRDLVVRSLGHLSVEFAEFQERFEAASVVEPVYEYRLFAPAGPDASMTFKHYFYGVFEVVSMLTR